MDAKRLSKTRSRTQNATSPRRRAAASAKPAGAANSRPQARPRPGLQFPLRVACIDVGSNAVRFVVAQFNGPTEMVTLVNERAPIRLGHDVFLTGRLAPQVINSTVEALRGFRRRMIELGVTHYRAVATSATRESRNGVELIEKARRKSGIELHVITGAEEGRLVHIAVTRRMPLGKERWLLVDLGGGSVEVSLADGEGLHWIESHNFGTVRLLEELAESGDRPGAFRRRLEEYVATLRIPSAARSQRPAGLIGTGGTMESIARLAGASPESDGVCSLSPRSLRRVIETLSRLSYRQRVEQLGLREDRADVVLPGAVIIERLAQLTHARRIVAPFVGLKDGVLFDLVDALTQVGGHEERNEKLVRAGARTVGRRYFYNEEHAEHVADLALSLFDQLRGRHAYAAPERRALLAAAMLHDIGSYISPKRHHKHSQYLIAASELPGMTPEEIELAAAVARYHRKGEPSPSHEPFGRLVKADRERVLRLAAILRLAEALDREHRRRVRRVVAAVDGATLLLQLVGAGDMLLERWSLRRKGQLFQRAFGLRVRIAGEPR